MKINIKNRVNT